MVVGLPSEACSDSADDVSGLPFLSNPLDLIQVAPAFSSEPYTFLKDSDHTAEQQHAVVHMHFC
jgi:hypothetical protein